MSEQKTLEESFTKIDEEDMAIQEETFLAKSVYQILHISRETIRYYEKLGLIHPAKQEENQYRTFSVHDLETLLWIDFYKKRNFQAKEIKTLLEYDQLDDMKQAYEKKKDALEAEIAKLQRKLDFIEKDEAFLNQLPKQVHSFTIQDMPLLEVLDGVSSVAAIFQANGDALQNLNWEEENYLTNLVRCVTFTDQGYEKAEVVYVKEVEQQEKGKTYLQSGRSVYTVVESEIHTTDTMGRMFLLYYDWLKEHHLQHKGIVYIRPRMLMMGNHPRIYLDCWVPIED